MFSTLRTSILAKTDKINTQDNAQSNNKLFKKIAEHCIISTRSPDWKTRRNPELAGGCLGVSMRPNPREEANPWRAELSICINDLPALMKTGLFLSDANVDTKHSCIVAGEDVTPMAGEKRWAYERQYYIEHVEGNTLQWKGTLRVVSMSLEVLREFRIGRLSADMVCLAVALNTDGQAAYHFNANYSQDNFNALLDDLPLKGLWPWPKEKNEKQYMEDKRKWEMEDSDEDYLV
jgi:hypothetical protein